MAPEIIQHQWDSLASYYILAQASKDYPMFIHSPQIDEWRLEDYAYITRANIEDHKTQSTNCNASVCKNNLAYCPTGMNALQWDRHNLRPRRDAHLELVGGNYGTASRRRHNYFIVGSLFSSVQRFHDFQEISSGL